MPNIQDTLHPVVISQVIVNFAEHYGVDKETCLLGTHISPAQLQDSEALISSRQEMALIENLILALPNEAALGFKLGLQYNVSTFGVWGFALRTSRTLHEAMVLGLRYLPLSTAYCRLQLFEENGFYGVIFNADLIPSSLRQFLLERDMATGINIIHELSLVGVKISSIEFQGEPPDYVDYIESQCGFRPIYHSSRNAMMIKVEEASRVLPTFDAQLVKLMNEQCHLQLQRRQQVGIIGQVRQQILGSLGLVASLEQVAEALAMSPRSLRRKLEHENTSFKLLLDQERQQIAKQLLVGSQMKLDELAFHLGYTDTASFSRAFRRWENCSAGEYRKNR